MKYPFGIAICYHLRLIFIKKNAADGFFMNFFPKRVGW